MPKKLSDNPAAIEAAARKIWDEPFSKILLNRTSWDAHIHKAKQILLAAEKAEGKQ